MASKKRYVISADDDAVISEDGLYRYSLYRDLYGPRLAGILGYIMLNPSTADAFTDDPTISRCTERAKRLGYGGMRVCNLYAYRASSPKELKKANYPIGPENDKHILLMARECNLIIIGWGNYAQPERAKQVRDLLKLLPIDTYKAPVYHLGLTKSGQPKHPLYISYNTKMKRTYL